MSNSRANRGDLLRGTRWLATLAVVLCMSAGAFAQSPAPALVPTSAPTPASPSTGAFVTAIGLPFKQVPVVPEPLSPYVGWALHDLRDLPCAHVPDGVACTWPGLLAVDVRNDHAAFSLDVWLDRPGRVRLPGDERRFPQQVRDGDRPAMIVRDDDGLPFALLLAGHHRVSGRFPWRQPPETLPVDESVGRVVLLKGGVSIERPRREGGQLWLGQEARSDEDVSDSLRVRIFRRLDDGVPLRLTTRLEVQASGRARDVALGVLLPKGALPRSLDGGGLPAVIGDDGSLRLHVRPGGFRVEIGAVLPDNPQAVAVPAHATGTDIEATEAWAWFADEKVRSVEISGLTPVDPARAGLPDDWRGGSSLLARAGESLTLKVSRRGRDEAPPDALTLERSFWLDLGGGGMTIRDNLKGEMHRAWRVEFAADGSGARLGRVHDNRLSTDSLITRAPGSSRDGVELRDGRVDLVAEARVVGDVASFDAVGWDLDPTSLSAQLHLPPGWTLLAARGVDRAPGTWISSWSLLDFFLVLMVAAAAARLFGLGAGLLALFAMLIGHDQPDAPAWIWLHLLAATALLRVVPAGWLRHIVRAWRGVAGITLLVMLVPFAIDQIRGGIYPQISSSSHGGGGFARSTTLEDFAATTEGMDNDNVMVQDKESKAQMVQEAAQDAAPSEGESMRSGGALSSQNVMRKGGGAQQKAYRNLIEVDPKAVVQTGEGVPDWNWSTWQLSWTGPVRRDHRVELYLLSPAVNLLLAILRVLAMALLGLIMLEVRRNVGVARQFVGRTTGLLGVLPLMLALALTAAAVVTPSTAQANPAAATNVSGSWPPLQVLETLRDRLAEAEACGGPCTTTPTAKLILQADGAVRIEAEVFAARDAGWALPGGLTLGVVTIDGQPSTALRRQVSGVVWLRLPAGRHAVGVTGQLAAGQVVTLAFDPSSKPQRIDVDAAGWRVDGIGPDDVPDESLQLGRQAPADRAQPAAELAGDDLPDWFAVERRLLLGLPWNVETHVRRDRAGRPALIKLPLLAGEAVLSEGVRVEVIGGKRVALIALDRDQSEVVVSSQLAIAPSLSLVAARDVPWTETWIVDCSPIWRCSHQGIAPTSIEGDDHRLRPTFEPWPGEKVDLTIVRPTGAEGQALTVDQVRLHISPGQRLTEGRLTMHVRASQGASRQLTLPDGAELRSVRIAGKDRAIAASGRTLTLPIDPGESVIEVRWQRPTERALIEPTPALNIGGPAVNAHIELELGEDRWLLWASGPSWGPAVLFWSHLLVLILLALLLSRLQGLPLRTHQWLLLCLGFANLPVATVLLFVAWLVALAWRRRYFAGQATGENIALFGLTQLALVALTLVALGALYAAIHANLLLDIDMQVVGNGCSNHKLVWYVDRVDGTLPEAAMVSVPIWVWRGAMLLWSLWLAASLLRWLPWAWTCFSDGSLWRKSSPVLTPEASTAAAPSGPPRDDLPPPPAT